MDVVMESTGSYWKVRARSTDFCCFFGAFIDHGVDLEIFYEHEAE